MKTAFVFDLYMKTLDESQDVFTQRYEQQSPHFYHGNRRHLQRIKGILQNQTRMK